MASRGKLADIDLEELERLSALQATDQEVASWFGVTTRTIERKRKQPKFAEAMEKGRAKGRLTIRRAQLRMLEQGNATMGIWLGKQYLGQTDEIRHEVNVSAHLSVIMPRAVETTMMAGTGVARQLVETSEDQKSIDVEPAG